MKKIKSIILLCLCLLFTFSVASYANGDYHHHSQPLPPYPPIPPNGTYHMFLRAGANLSEQSFMGTDDFPLVGGYIGFGSLWDVARRWQIGAELGFAYIGCGRSTVQTANQQPVGPSVLDDVTDFRTLLYHAAAVFVYKLTPHVFLNSRIGLAVEAFQSTQKVETPDTIRNQVAIVVTKTSTAQTGVLLGAGFKFRMARPLFLTVDYDYVNITGLNLFRLGLEFDFNS